MSCEQITRDYRASLAKPPTSIRAQFGNPTGFVGRLIGYLMAFKNRERSEWVLSNLELKPSHRVLEIGFGPGIDIERVSKISAHVSGIDWSTEMVRMAESRNRHAIDEGRVSLHRGNACALPFEDRSFDRVFSINSVQFWDDLRVGLCEQKRVLVQGGLAAVAIQPRNKGATAQTAFEWGASLLEAMYEVGFGSVHIESMIMDPVPVVCALAIRRE